MALKKAEEIGTASTRIDVIHVAAPLSGPDNGALFLSKECHHRSLLIKRFMDELDPALRDRRILFDVEFGNTGRELNRAAKRLKTDLIILAANERSRWHRMLFGNVSEYLQKHAACDIRFVHAPDHQRAIPSTVHRAGELAHSSTV